MSDQEVIFTPDQKDLEWQGRSVDWYLQTLVNIVNGSGISFGITLFVEGAVISGQLVGGRKYFEEFASEFSGAYPGDEKVKDLIRDAIAGHANIYRDEVEEGEGEGEKKDKLSSPQYLHLIDARCFTPGGGHLPENHGTLWRGKVTSVSGFSLGSIA